MFLSIVVVVVVAVALLFGEDGSSLLVGKMDVVYRVGSVLEAGRVVVEVGWEEDLYIRSQTDVRWTGAAFHVPWFQSKPWDVLIHVI